MKLYETVLRILEKKGSLSLPTLCEEINSIYEYNCEKSVHPSDLKALLSRRNEVLKWSDGFIDIHPDKYPIYLTAYIEGFGEESYQVRVDFEKNRFTYLAWSTGKQNDQKKVENHIKIPGDVGEFKKEIYLLNLWNWKPQYQLEEGIILDGTNWRIRLTTKGKVYESEGEQCFPINWRRFCRAIEKLTDSKFR